MDDTPAFVALDFDGVILESVEIKTQAFASLFSDYPDHLPAIVELHRRHGGVSRFVKFERIHREILDIPFDDHIAKILGRRFETLVREKMLACPFVPGAEAFLSEMHQRVPLHVVSGTPEDELNEIVANRKLGGYFDSVLGSPETKPALLTKLLRRYSCPPSSAIMVGDAQTDFEAAKAVGMGFIGRTPFGENNPFPPSIIIVPDLRELSEVFRRRDWTKLACSV